MGKVIRTGVSRQDLMGIMVRSERPEEAQRAQQSIAFLDQIPDYDPDAIGLFINGTAMAAGGLRQAGPTLGVLWIVSCVDLEPYRFPLMRHAHALTRRAKQRGWAVVSFVPNAVDRAKNPSVHLGLKPRPMPDGARTLYA
jgi:hypothetical protein